MDKDLRIGKGNTAKGIRPYDIYFAVSFCLLMAGFLYMIQTGLGVPDESFYVTIPHRLMQGDRLILDDWHVSQFSSFMQYLPVKLFFDRTGSFDGVILFLRYLYVIFQGITLLILYPFFRKYEWRGAVALSVFGGYIPVTLPTLNYYTLCLWPAVIICAAIHFREKLSAPALVILGILTGIAVLAEPMIACCYFIYTLAVLLRIFVSKKHPGFLTEYGYYINLRYWGFITIGVFVSAAAFLPFLFRNSDPASTLTAIPYLFNGYEYNFSLSDGNIQTAKVISRALSIYGKAPAVGLAALTVIAAVAAVVKKQRECRPFLCAGLIVCFVIAYKNALTAAYTVGRNDYYALFYGLPLYLSGPAVYFMLEKRDKRLWAFWCSGAVLSVFLDVSSAVILGVCGAISAAATVMFIFELAGECLSGSRQQPEEKKSPLLIAGFSAAVILLTGFIGQEVYYDIFRLDFNFTEADWSRDFTNGACDTLLTRGPYKGIKTTKTLAAKYNGILDDLDIIRESGSAPVLMFDRFPYCYLYVDKPYATFSAWYVENDENDRLLYYYDVYPERIPEYVYLPLYDPYTYKTDKTVGEKLQWLESVFDCVTEQTDTGYVLKITDLKDVDR